MLPASRSISNQCDAIFPLHTWRPPVILTAHLRLKGPWSWMRFDASKRPRCTALPPNMRSPISQGLGTPPCRNAGGDFRTLPSSDVTASVLARHERVRAFADRRHQSRNALQNSSSPLTEETFFTSRTLITAMPRACYSPVDYCICKCPACMYEVPKPATQRTCARDRHLKQEAER